MSTIKFRTPKEKVKLSANKQGLRADNRVFVKGRKSGATPDGAAAKSEVRPSLKDSLASLRRQMDDDGGPLSSYPDLIGDKKRAPLARMARMNGSVKKKKLAKKKKSRKGSDADDESSVGASFARPMRPVSTSTGKSTTLLMRTPPALSDSENDSGSGGECSDDVLSIPSDDSDASDSDMSDNISIASSTLSSVGARRQKPIPVSKGLGAALGAGSGSKAAASGLSKHEAEEAEKNDLLARFHILRQRGVHLSKNFTPKSSLQEMRIEMGRIEHENQVARAVRINRRFCLMGASGLTRITDDYAPRVVRGRWHGFDKHMLANIEEFDEPFERLSEEYGGVVSALSGGNPMMEIFILFMYQFISYGLMNNGGEQARTNEEMTDDEIKRRYPNLVRKAVEEEMKRREDDRVQEMQREQRRRQYELFEQAQQATQQMHASGFHNFHDRPSPMQPPMQAPMQAPVNQQMYQQMPRPVQPPDGFGTGNFVFEVQPPPPVLNEEHPAAQQLYQPPHAPDQHNAQQQAFGGHASGQPPVMPSAQVDPYLFEEMHAALPYVDPRSNYEHGHYDDMDDVSVESGGSVGSPGGSPAPAWSQEEPQDNLDIPSFTRLGRPRDVKPPPNKRDMQTPFGDTKSGKNGAASHMASTNNEEVSRNTGKFVVNIE